MSTSYSQAAPNALAELLLQEDGTYYCQNSKP